MPSAHRVPRLAEHAQELGVRTARDRTHARPVRVRDALVDLGPTAFDPAAATTGEVCTFAERGARMCVSGSVVGAVREVFWRKGRGRRVGQVVRVAEARAPVAEVAADDEGVGWVRDVGREELAEGGLGGGGRAADHDWDEGRIG